MTTKTKTPSCPCGATEKDGVECPVCRGTVADVGLKTLCSVVKGVQYGSTYGSEGTASKYRYALWRVWGDPFNLCVFVMLNPSTATHEEDDPTIRRCGAFAKLWGYGGLAVVNLFAFRSTLPAALKEVVDPIGPANTLIISRYARVAKRLVVAWGTDGGLRDRDRQVCTILAAQGTQTVALKLTADGFPNHPLYIPANAQPIIYPGRPSWYK